MPITKSTYEQYANVIRGKQHFSRANKLKYATKDERSLSRIISNKYFNHLKNNELSAIDTIILLENKDILSRGVLNIEKLHTYYHPRIRAFLKDLVGYKSTCSGSLVKLNHIWWKKMWGFTIDKSLGEVNVIYRFTNVKEIKSIHAHILMLLNNYTIVDPICYTNTSINILDKLILATHGTGAIFDFEKDFLELQIPLEMLITNYMEFEDAFRALYNAKVEVVDETDNSVAAMYIANGLPVPTATNLIYYRNTIFKVDARKSNGTPTSNPDKVASKRSNDAMRKLNSLFAC